MSDLPKSIRINEEGPREGFQFEKGPIATARKIELIDSLSKTGLKQIQLVSFVPPQNVPGMADADEVVRGFTAVPGVSYTGMWLNERGFQRAIAIGKLDIKGSLYLCASEAFLNATRDALFRKTSKRSVLWVPCTSNTRCRSKPVESWRPSAAILRAMYRLGAFST